MTLMTLQLRSYYSDVCYGKQLEYQFGKLSALTAANLSADQV